MSNISSYDLIFSNIENFILNDYLDTFNFVHFLLEYLLFFFIVIHILIRWFMTDDFLISSFDLFQLFYYLPTDSILNFSNSTSSSAQFFPTFLSMRKVSNVWNIYWHDDPQATRWSTHLNHFKTSISIIWFIYLHFRSRLYFILCYYIYFSNFRVRDLFRFRVGILFSIKVSIWGFGWSLLVQK